MRALLAYIGIFSVVVSVVSLGLVSLFVIHIPRDYFAESKPPELPLKTRHPWLKVALAVCKNGIGVFLILTGIVFLALPGQGILTILVGLILLDFPGKRALELRLVKRPEVLSTLNWIRRKFGREPFVV